MRTPLKWLITERIIVSFIIFIFGVTAYASAVDTFYFPLYKISNKQLKKCLSQIAVGESDKHHQPIGLVVSCFSQDNEQYVLVGCHTFSWLKFYSMLQEVRDNDFVGCSYLKNYPCFLFGNGIEQYLSDSVGMVSIADSNGNFKPLLGSEEDLKEWFEGYCQSDLVVDPPVWIFKKHKRKFVRISNSDFQYTPHRIHLRSAL